MQKRQLGGAVTIVTCAILAVLVYCASVADLVRDSPVFRLQSPADHTAQVRCASSSAWRCFTASLCSVSRRLAKLSHLVCCFMHLCGSATGTARHACQEIDVLDYHGADRDPRKANTQMGDQWGQFWTDWGPVEGLHIIEGDSMARAKLRQEVVGR